MIIWFTGLSGAGKTVYANHLKEKGFIVIDGDQMRSTLSSDLGFTYEEKQEHGRRMIAICKMFADYDVVVSTIVADNKGRDWVRRELPHAKFVWIKASLDTCEKRDTKGLYKKNLPYLAGVTSLWEDPVNVDLSIDTDADSMKDSKEKLDRMIEKWTN